MSMIETQAMIADTLIFSALYNENAANYIAAHVTGDDFFHAEHRGLIDNIREAVANGKPVTPPSIVANVKGGAEAIERIVSTGLSADQYEFYVEKAREISAKQTLSVLANEIKALANDEKADLNTILSQVESGLSCVETGNASKGKPIKLREAAKDWLKDFQERMESGVIRGLSTGFEGLDNLIAGLQGGRLYVLAGRPGSGKSIVALSMAKNVAAEGKKVLYISLEMAVNEVIDRAVADWSGVYLSNIEDGLRSLRSEREKTKQFEAVASSLSMLVGHDITVWDETNIGIADIALECQRMKRSEGVDLIIVDYLGLIESTGNDEVKELGEMSRRLKNLAAELDTPIIALHQVNRSCENRENKRPNKSDLRGSGKIEENANVVMLTYREDVYQKDRGKHTGDMEIIVDKNRSGACGVAMLTTDLSRMRIADKHTPFDSIG